MSLIANDPVLPAMSIHPSLLEGLVPVNTPAFIGIDGGARTVETRHLQWKEENFENNPLDTDNLPLIYRCVTQAKNLGWVYFHSIALGPVAEGYIDVFIRGCA